MEQPRRKVDETIVSYTYPSSYTRCIIQVNTLRVYYYLPSENFSISINRITLYPVCTWHVRAQKPINALLKSHQHLVLKLSKPKPVNQGEITVFEEFLYIWNTGSNYDMQELS